jgi:hypothetical protein
MQIGLELPFVIGFICVACLGAFVYMEALRR